MSLLRCFPYKITNSITIQLTHPPAYVIVILPLHALAIFISISPAEKLREARHQKYNICTRQLPVGAGHCPWGGITEGND